MSPSGSSLDRMPTYSESARTIAERRRRRRAAERRRRAALRRRNALLGIALVTFALGALAGGRSAGAPQDGSRAGERLAEASDATAEADVPTTTGFAQPLPVLMYHAISQAPAGSAYPNLFMPAQEFAAQMRWLAAHGYHAVTLDEVFAAWEQDAPIAVKPIVVSFDDGLRSQYASGFPVLRRLEWPGVLNLKVQSLDEGELTEEMVGEMVDAGWEIDSHTFTHRDLTTLPAPELRREVAGSRAELQERFDEPVDFFCYPAGAYDAEAIAAVRRAGYLGATTTEPGLASPDQPFELNRVRVEPGDGTEGLAAKLAGA